MFDNDFENFLREFNSTPAMQNDFKAFSAAIDLEKEMNGLTEEEATEKVTKSWDMSTMLAGRRLEQVEQLRESLNDPAKTEAEIACIKKNLAIIDF